MAASTVRAGRGGRRRKAQDAQLAGGKQVLIAWARRLGAEVLAWFPTPSPPALFKAGPGYVLVQFWKRRGGEPRRIRSPGWPSLGERQCWKGGETTGGQMEFGIPREARDPAGPGIG